MSEKLKPCPFCGRDVKWHDDIYGGMPGTFIVCGYCRNQFGGGSNDWNTRVYPPEVQAVIEAARDYVKVVNQYGGFAEQDCYNALKEAVLALEESERE